MVGLVGGLVNIATMSDADCQRCSFNVIFGKDKVVGIKETELQSRIALVFRI